MFKKLISLFKKSNISKPSSDLVEEGHDVGIEIEASKAEIKKKTVLVFDQKNRVFITKTKYSTVASFCPIKKEFQYHNKNGDCLTIVFNPRNDDEFAYPVSGDWLGEGYDGIGIYYPKSGDAFLKYNLNNENENEADVIIDYDVEGEYIPLAGNWDGTGKDTLGFYVKKTSMFIFPEKNIENRLFSFGKRGHQYLPICGDWMDTGFDSLGLYEPETSMFRLLKNLNSNKADTIFRFGSPGEGNFYPVAGNWTEGGRCSIGLVDMDQGVVRLKNTAEAGTADSFVGMNFLERIPLSISVYD